MDRKTMIMLDLIRNVNILNISLLLGVFLSWLGINRYLVFIAMLFCCALLSYFTQKSFTSKYGLYNSLAGSTVFVLRAAQDFDFKVLTDKLEKVILED